MCKRAPYINKTQEVAVRDVPSGSLADVKIKRSSRILSSQTAFSVAVSTRFPDWSNSLTLATPVQSGFTESVPTAVDSVTVPFKLPVTVPLRFPGRVQSHQANSRPGSDADKGSAVRDPIVPGGAGK